MLRAVLAGVEVGKSLYHAVHVVLHLHSSSLLSAVQHFEKLNQFQPDCQLHH